MMTRYYTCAGIHRSEVSRHEVVMLPLIHDRLVHLYRRRAAPQSSQWSLGILRHTRVNLRAVREPQRRRASRSVRRVAPRCFARASPHRARTRGANGVSLRLSVCSPEPTTFPTEFPMLRQAVLLVGFF